jgi:hypothetical protein
MRLPILIFMAGWASAFAQGIMPAAEVPVTNFERYSTIGLFSAAIVAQYWENRKKDADMAKRAEDWMKAETARTNEWVKAVNELTKAIEHMGDR